MNNYNEIEEEITYDKKLYGIKYLPGPIECKCHSKVFNIYYDNQYKVNPMSFTCCNSHCPKKFPITINSFLENFQSKNWNKYRN